MAQYQETKPLAKLTNKEWRGTIIALTFIGVFVLVYGLFEGNWQLTRIGLVFVLIGIVGGFILHFFFGIKIISLRRDMKHAKY